MASRQYLSYGSYVTFDGVAGRPLLTISGVGTTNYSSTGIIDLASVFSLGTLVPTLFEGTIKLKNALDATSASVVHDWKLGFAPAAGAAEDLLTGAIPTTVQSNVDYALSLALTLDLNDALTGFQSGLVASFKWNTGTALNTAKTFMFGPRQLPRKGALIFANASPDAVPTDATLLLSMRPVFVFEDFATASGTTPLL